MTRFSLFFDAELLYREATAFWTSLTETRLTQGASEKMQFQPQPKQGISPTTTSERLPRG